LPQPRLKTDLLPKNDKVQKASSDNLPFESDSMQSIMFDPPFVIAGETYKDNDKGSSIIAKRFEGYKNFDELKIHYFGTLKETYRLLKEDGILVFKCQDVVSSGKNHFSHCLIMNMALQVGFYPKDLFILMAKNRINSFNGEKWKNQFHARKHHSYFWVLQKSKCRVDYGLS
jgi:tRNA G10  N-methylase Trm11